MTEQEKIEMLTLFIYDNINKYPQDPMNQTLVSHEEIIDFAQHYHEKMKELESDDKPEIKPCQYNPKHNPNLDLKSEKMDFNGFDPSIAQNIEAINEIDEMMKKQEERGVDLSKSQGEAVTERYINHCKLFSPYSSHGLNKLEAKLKEEEQKQKQKMNDLTIKSFMDFCREKEIEVNISVGHSTVGLSSSIREKEKDLLSVSLHPDLFCEFVSSVKEEELNKNETVPSDKNYGGGIGQDYTADVVKELRKLEKQNKRLKKKLKKLKKEQFGLEVFYGCIKPESSGMMLCVDSEKKPYLAYYYDDDWDFGDSPEPKHFKYCEIPESLKY